MTGSPFWNAARLREMQMDDAPYMKNLVAHLDDLVHQVETASTLPRPCDLYYAVKRAKDSGWNYRVTGFTVSALRDLIDFAKTALQMPIAPKKQARPSDLNAFCAEVHRDNAHWWHDPATGAKLDRNMGEMLMLVVSEIAECMEGERKDLMDDHLPHRKMAEVELADAVIRLADILGSRENTDLRVLFADVLHGEPDELPDNKGEALLQIASPLHQTKRFTSYVLNRKLARCFHRIELYAEKHGYDLWAAVAEKREYNKHRADHKPEARLAAGGKKW